MVVGGVAVIGLAAGGWVLLGDGSAPLVGGGEDNRESPESVMQAYVDALNAADVAAMADLLHEESPLDEPEEGDLSGVEDLEFTLENATVVDEEVSEVASNYDSVQEFEMIEYTIAVEGEGKTERAFVVAKNQDGEWKLWDEATTISTSTPSEDTGTESTKQVADNLNVLTEVGVVGPDNTISELRIGVQPAAGVDEINLAELTLQYVSDDEFANLLVGEDTSTGTQAEGDSDPANIQSTAGENNYLVDVIMAERDDDIVMTDSADRYELVVPLDDERAANPQPDLAVLDEGMAVEITITTEAGAQVVAFLQVPETLDEAEPGERVAL
jgi:flagellin FlaB